MKQLGKLVALVLLTVNLIVAGLLLFAAYSPFLSAEAHPVASCMGLAFPIFALLNGCFLLFWLLFQRYKSALLPLGVFLLCGSQLGTYFPFHLFPDDPPEGSLKILSYNVMSFGGGVKKDGENPILAYLRDSKADIICLQEYNVWPSKGKVTQKDVDAALKAYPYRRIHMVGESKRRGSRLACFSKYPILSAKKLDVKSRHNGSVLYEIKVGEDTLTLVNNHLESNKLNDEDKEIYEELLSAPEEETVKRGTRHLLHKLADAVSIRARQADVVAAAVASSPHPYVVVCGDFNDSPISYTHRTIGQGLDDAFARTGCGPGISYNKNKFFFRIDHILMSRNLKAYRCGVDRSIKASDHYPISCRLAKRNNE